MTEPRSITEARALLEMGVAMVDAGTLKGVLEEYDRTAKQNRMLRLKLSASDREIRLALANWEHGDAADRLRALLGEE